MALTIKLTFLSLFFFLLSAGEVFSSSGLSQDITTRELLYTFQPAYRNVFTSRGHREKFDERNIQMLRDRLTPMLDRFSQIKSFYQNKNISFIDYDPTLETIIITKENLAKIKTSKYPVNLKWRAEKEFLKGLEFITLSFDKSPKIEDFMNIMKSYEQLLGLNLKKEISKKKRILNEKEKEMLEQIKNKKIHFYKYQEYYGISYFKDIWINASYFSDYKKKVEEHFASIQEKVKYQLYRSKEINLAINSKILLNLEKEIEEEDIKDLTEPFMMREGLIPGNLKRFTKQFKDIKLDLLIARKNKTKSVDPIINKILDSIN